MLPEEIVRRILSYAIRADDAYCRCAFPEKTVTCAWFSHGRTVAIGSLQSAVYIVRSRDGATVRTIEVEEVVDSVACSARGVLAVAEYCGRVTLWREDAEHSIGRIEGIPFGFQTVVFDKGGEALVVGTGAFDNNTVSVWRAEDCALIVRWNVGDLLRSIDWAADGATLATCSNQKSVQLWGVRRDAREVNAAGSLDCAAYVDIVRFVPIDRSKLVAALASSGRMLLWVGVGTASPRIASVFESSILDFSVSRSAECLAFNTYGDKFAAAWARNTSVKVWEDIETAPRVTTLWGTAIGEIHACAFSPTDPGLLCVVSYEGKAQFWRSGEWSVEAHPHFSPRQKKKAVAAFCAAIR